MSNKASNEKFSFRIAANYPNPPYFYTKTKEMNGESKTIIINGIDYHLIKTLVQYFNSSYEFIHANWSWGKQVNGSWNGMIGKIINNSANMALGALSSNSEREKVVDFTVPYYYSDITFFTRLTKMSSINAETLLIEPFSKAVWFYLISSVVLSSVALKFFNQSFKETFGIMMRSLLQKGSPSVPHSLRFFAIIWLLFGFILSTYYASFIYLFMSELIPRPGIGSIEELAIAVKKGEYIPATSGGGSLFNQIKSIESSPLNFIGEALIDIDRVANAMQYMLTNMTKLSYICPRLLINARSKMFEPNSFNLPPKNGESTFIMEQLSIALPKDFKFKNQINMFIRRLESSAHLYHWERLSMKEKLGFNNQTMSLNLNQVEGSKGLALDTIKYIFYLWFFGFIFAAFVLTVEMVITKISPSIIKIIERFLSDIFNYFSIVITRDFKIRYFWLVNHFQTRRRINRNFVR